MLRWLASCQEMGVVGSTSTAWRGAAVNGGVGVLVAVAVAVAVAPCDVGVVCVMKVVVLLVVRCRG